MAGDWHAASRFATRRALAGGVPELTFGELVDGKFEEQFMPSYRPATRGRYRDLLRQRVRVLAGHATLETTQRYAHATDADLQVAVQKLGR